MYLRFVIHRQDALSGSMQGVFQAAFELRDRGELAPHEDEWLRGELAWLKMHLKDPSCLADPENRRAVCWFHPRAMRPIERVRSIVALLREHGIAVTMLKSRDPGIIIYEDGWQVVAKPRRRRRNGEPSDLSSS